MKNKIFTLISKVATVSLLVLTLAPAIPAGATAITNATDASTRLKISVAADHQLTFTTTSAISTVGQTIDLTFQTGFDTSSITAGNGDVSFSSSLDGGAFLIGTSCAGNKLTFANPGSNILRFTICTGATITSGSAVTIKIGKNVNVGSNQVVNPSSAGSYTVVIGGTAPLSGTMYDGIVDSDQVAISAAIDGTLLFDLDTNTSNADSGAPYVVHLGSMTTGAVNTSDGATVNSIYVDLATNGTGGAAVTVQSLNGALKSLTVGTDVIGPSSTATVVAGTSNYGICVKSVSQTAGATLTAVAPFNTAGNCTYANHNVGGLTGGNAIQSILTASSALAGGRSEILVKAAISTSTKAHDDYQDTLTFLAAAQF